MGSLSSSTMVILDESITKPSGHGQPINEGAFGMTIGSGIAIAGIWISWGIICQSKEVTSKGAWVFFFFACMGSWIFK